jgi:hypothetical protein
VSDRELRMDAGRDCWCRKGGRKEGNDVNEGDGKGCKSRDGSRGGMLAQFMIVMELFFASFDPFKTMPRSVVGLGANKVTPRHLE